MNESQETLVNELSQFVHNLNDLNRHLKTAAPGFQRLLTNIAENFSHGRGAILRWWEEIERSGGRDLLILSDMKYPGDQRFEAARRLSQRFSPSRLADKTAHYALVEMAIKSEKSVKELSGKV